MITVFGTSLALSLAFSVITAGVAEGDLGISELICKGGISSRVFSFRCREFPHAFPAVGAHAVDAVTVNPFPSPVESYPCDCPKRQMPPSPLTKIPFLGLLRIDRV